MSLNVGGPLDARCCHASALERSLKPTPTSMKGTLDVFLEQSGNKPLPNLP